ncbi:MAG: hypothetical protein GY869_19150 [Planctomycetes bacterium]|nr:hypothetical protein [Planctomycetota bacterium]
MNKIKSSALINLLGVVPAFAIICFSFTVVALTVKYSILFLVGIWLVGTGSGFLWLLPILKPGLKPNQGGDERDIAIHKKAVLVAYSVFWVCFVSAGVYLCYHFRQEGSVPVAVFVTFIFGGLMVFFLALTIAALIQYKIGGANHE